MFRRTEVTADGSGRGPEGPRPGGPTPAGNFVVDPSAPNVSGDLDALLSHAPVFRAAVRGYDRLEVDNYVAWAEAELRAARRETDDLVERYGRACAELEISRRLLARSPEGREMSVISERMGEMLRMAADEAAALTAAGQEEADQILADARTEADARLRKAHEIKQMAIEASDRMREEARLVRAEAAAELERARARAAAVLREAEAERARLAEEERAERERLAREAAAASEAALKEARDQLAELERRRKQACESLLRLDEHIGVALDTVADADDLAGTGPTRHATV